MELPSRDAIAFEWSMTMMNRAFRDLAASFAAVNPALADEAVKRIEQMVAAEMDRMIKKPPEGISVGNLRAAIAEAVGPFREMTQSARQLIKQAGKPKN
jgi:hypothetical protein